MAKKRNEFDTGRLPPGTDFGEDLPDRGQSPNTGGAGASKADLERGHTSVPDPDPANDRLRHQTPEGGFLERWPYSVER